VEEVRGLLRRYILLPDVWELLGSLPSEVPELFADELEQFPGEAAPSTGEVMVALDQSVAVGFGEVVPHAGDMCELKRVHVVAAHEGVGIGSLMARALLEQAHALGYQRVVLDVLPSRTRARALWASVGFEEIEPYRSYPTPMVFMGRALQ
jgi:ribosomal protein S18 acetylase RimI-like enzyme